MKKFEVKDRFCERLIVALDFPDIASAKNLVDKLGDEVVFYKIGLELLMSGGYFELIDWLAKRNKKIFVDLKLFDIAKTIAKALKNLSQYPNIDLATIHCGNRQMMEEAAQNKGVMRIVAVTILTNFDQNDLSDLGFDQKISLNDLVVKRAKLAHECGIDGVVASGFEAKSIRESIGNNFLIITPGVRLEALKNDDQKRIIDVKTAFKNGANYIVVGRPITLAADPKIIVQKIQRDLIEIL